MFYSDYEFEETGVSELLEDGVYLEHFVSDTADAEMTDVGTLFGDPEADALLWSRAQSDCDDGIMCEKYIADALTCSELAAEDVMNGSALEGRYSADYGSTLQDAGSYLEGLDLRVERDLGCTVADLCEALEQNERIICAVSSVALYYPELEDMPGLAADTLVEVIGVDEAGSDGRTVVVNNPFAACGGSPIAEDAFVSAWSKSGCYAVFAGQNGGSAA